MKEHIKKFATPAAADGYVIEDIPWIATVESTGQNVVCNEEGMECSNNDGFVEIVSSWPLNTILTLNDGGVESTVEIVGTELTQAAISDVYKSTLVSAVVGRSVTSIGGYTFQDCTGLTSVTIPNSVTSIGNGAFYDCSGLTSIEIPNSVTSIGYSAFYDCSGLTSIEIPSSVTSIGERAFANVLNIVYNGTATGSPWGAKHMNGYVDGYLVYSNATKTELLGCSSKAIGEIVIPNSVTKIESNVFGAISTKILFSELYLTYTNKIFNTPNQTCTYNVEFNISEIPTDYNISSMLPIVADSGKVTLTYNIYTDYAPCKDQALALATTKTIVNVYHIDGTPWE